jgi:hypothetical protein
MMVVVSCVPVLEQRDVEGGAALQVGRGARRDVGQPHGRVLLPFHEVRLAAPPTKMRESRRKWEKRLPVSEKKTVRTKRLQRKKYEFISRRCCKPPKYKNN